MTVGELIAELEGMPEDAPVLFASQPSWPFEYSINSVVEVMQEKDLYLPGESSSIVYLSEGEQLGYLNELAQQELGW